MKKLRYLIPALMLCLMAVSCDNTGGSGNQSEEGQDTLLTNNGQEQSEQNDVREIQVVAENMRFNPSEIRVSPGETVRIRLQNRGEEEHNIEFELPDGEEELENNVDPGQEGTLEFTAPQQSGSYTVYCPVNDHKDHGMTGSLVVE